MASPPRVILAPFIVISAQTEIQWRWVGRCLLSLGSRLRDLPKTSGRFQRQGSPGMAALKARQEYSPRQRPGDKMFPGTSSPERAQHIHRNPCADICLCISTVSPLRGCALVDPQNPGRCPGLYYHCRFRASGSRSIRTVACFEGVAGFLEGPLRGNDILLWGPEPAAPIPP